MCAADGLGGTKQATLRAGKDRISGGALDALQYWLLASGIPTTFCLLCGHRPAGIAAGHAADLPIDTYSPLLKHAAGVCGVQCDVGSLRGTRWVPRKVAAPAVAHSLMYS